MMKDNNKKPDKRTVIVRLFCILLAGLMVLGGVAYALVMLLG